MQKSDLINGINSTDATDAAPVYAVVPAGLSPGDKFVVGTIKFIGVVEQRPQTGGIPADIPACIELSI